MDTSWAIYELDKTEIFKTHLNDRNLFMLLLAFKAFSPAEVQHYIVTFPKKKSPNFKITK
ncbi:putative RNA-directed DNA polymerase [Aphis craccivora]|uniref:Putative RNA-directed DNA polymerase n=1 Tax=Aphis craccivora TaxID=307492 RepID=A0A6G0YG77_APHCR|nr:putative RNA-directed DNA polymerase [Aphis craccivora]